LLIEIPPEHNKYDFGSPVHEAGFDSFLTARVLIRLSTKTEAERNSSADAPDAESEASLSASEDGGVALTAEQLKRATLHPSGKAGPYTFSDSNPFAALRNQGLEDVPPHTMMPHEHSPFWLQYGNKLRVNGTIEGACIIPIIR
jgi:poly(A)-specific ribonuclease